MKRFPREIRRAIAGMVVLVLAVVGLLVAWATHALPPRELVLIGAVVAIVFGAQELLAWDNWAAALVGLVTLALGGLLLVLRDRLPPLSVTKVLLLATAVGLFSDMFLHFFRGRRDKPPTEPREEP